MAYSINIPFNAIRLRFHSGGDVWFPLLDKEAVRIDTDLETLAGRYAESLQKDLLNAGHFRAILNEFQDGPFEKKKLRLSFPAQKDRFSHPTFDLEFEYLLRPVPEKGFWGLIPPVGIEALAKTEEELVKSLEELIRIDFTSNARLQNLHRIVSLIWFDSMELETTSVKATFPTPKELEQNPAVQSESWLNKVAYQPKVTRPAAYGREEELQKFILTLKSPYIRNVALLGPHGVGKTALVKELIRQKNKAGIQEEIWETTASLLIKELTTDMGWQENLSLFCKELHSRKVILFVRNLYELFEVGKYEGNTVSVADYLLPFLSRGEITLVGECTPEERALIDLNSPGWLGHFQVIQLEEPTAILEEIIKKKAGDIASDQKVELSPDAIEELIRLNKRYTPYAGFPGKPIRFLESLLLHKKSVPGERGKKGRLLLNKSEIIYHFCLETGMPPFMADPLIPVDFDAVRAHFASNVFGQDQAVDGLINVLASVKTGMSRTGKPIASFLFVGPTGVGKTELVKVLAEFMFGSRTRLTRFDMSEYSTGYSVRSLIGTGGDTEGMLTNAVRREPFGVILFDEVEKAHPSFFDYLLQVLSEGRLTDSRGQIANFCSSIIILTSNIGTSSLQVNPIGWKKDLEPQVVGQHFLHAVQQFFRPELFNRIDQVVTFRPLSRETMRQVVDREIQLLKTREGIKDRKMQLIISPEAMDLLAEMGFNPRYGARYLQRTIQTQLAIPLAYLLNQRDSLDHVVVKVNSVHNRLDIKAETDPLSMDLLLEELEKFNLANLSSDRRKEVQRLEDGAAYLRIINEMAILEREKVSQPQSFLQNGKKNRIFDQYRKTGERLGDLRKEIEQLEAGISLSCMGYLPYRPDFSKRLESWKESWERFRTDLFLQLFPGDSCWLSIYGTSLGPVVSCYHQIIKNLNFSLKGSTIWLHPSLANLPQNPDPDRWILTNSGGEYFLLRPWHDGSHWKQNPAPTDQDQTLYGVRWEIQGPGAHWFFLEESGIQRWMDDEGEFHHYFLGVSSLKAEIPNNIHRQEFYQNQHPRRLVASDYFSDNIYKIKNEYTGSDVAKYLQTLLEKRFNDRKEKELC